MAPERAKRDAPRLNVQVGAPASNTYPAMPTQQINQFRNLTYYAPSDCRSLIATGCDLTVLHLGKPAPLPTKDLQLDTTLTWDDSKGNALQYQIWDLRTAPDGTKYWGITHRGEDGKSPSHLLVSNPTETDYLIRVMNVHGTNTGYTLSASLSQPDLYLPTDLSAQSLVSGPAAAVKRVLAPLGAADNSFPLGQSLQVRANRAASVGHGGRDARSYLALVLAALLGVTAVGGLSLARVRDMRLVWKLLTPFLVVILVGGVTATFLTTRYLTSRASDQLDQSLLTRLMDDNASAANPVSAAEVTREAIVQSALLSAAAAENIGLPASKIILSAKVSDVQNLVAVYADLARRSPHALHLGLTEAGMGTKGVVASSAALALLLQQGIGDTIRISLTPEPGGDRTREVTVAQELLQVMGFRAFLPVVAACPGCGRTTSTVFQELAQTIQEDIRRNMPAWREKYPGVEELKVAVMGCIVNGPGESKHADIGISLPGTGETPAAPVFIDGRKAMTLRGPGIARDFEALVADYIENRFGRGGKQAAE